MNMQTVTLELPQNIYRQARRAAALRKQSVEQVVLEWIRPTQDELQPTAAEELSAMSDEQLRQIARLRVPQADAARFQELLDIQQERALTAVEQKEAADLLSAEESLTLRKARAIFLLKQRHTHPVPRSSKRAHRAAV